ncbi:hypothetical protein XENOCAPTIV_024610, partial [Xenoophorus captivus]
GGPPHKPVLPLQQPPGSQSVVGPSQAPPPINPTHPYQVKGEQAPTYKAPFTLIPATCFLARSQNVVFMSSSVKCLTLQCVPLICFLQNPAPMSAAQVAAQMAVDAANNQKNRCKLTGGAKLLRIINFCQALFCTSWFIYHGWDFVVHSSFFPLDNSLCFYCVCSVFDVYQSRNCWKGCRCI